MRWLLAAVLLSGQAADEERLKRLVEQLGADFLEEREEARKQLEAAGGGAEKALVRALDHADHRVRRTCLELLAPLKSTAALPRASDLFKRDEDPGVAEAAFRLLTALGEHAEAALVDALGHPTADYRRRALHELTRFKSGKAMGKAAELQKNDPEQAVREDAFRYLQALGPAAADWLLEMLGSREAAHRQGALEGLKGVATPKVLEAVGKLFAAEPDPSVSAAAGAHLEAAGNAALPFVVGALKSPHENARHRALQALRALRGPVPVEATAQLFREDPSERVRAEAKQVLAEQGAAAEDAFVAALESPHAQVRRLAVEGLTEIRGEKGLAGVARLWREDPEKEIRERAFDYFCRLGMKAEKELLAGLQDAEKPVRLKAVEALGAARSEAAVEPLLALLEGLDADLKKPALDALVRIGAPAVKAVEAAAAAGRLKASLAKQVVELHEMEEAGRVLDGLVTEEGGTGHFEGQFRGLEGLGKERAVGALLRIVQDPQYRFRAPERRESVQDYDATMRELAIMALGELGDRRAVDPLKGLLKEVGPESTNLRDEILTALHRLGESAPLKAYVESVRKEAEDLARGDRRMDAVRRLFSLGKVLNRSGQREEAEKAYLRLLEVAPEQVEALSEEDFRPNTWYNLACLAALRGDTATGVERLEKAVKAGFTDRDWIKLDRELDALR
ncbi:MAG TPA: HEAT repeat domain-containing protein, partial [Planctomycetota bacterium]|nr:HEAT repeat domain-containing protein [Planctomycetota bacterium]